MSDTLSEAPPPHLTEDEVLRLIEIVEDLDPVIVGGQALNLWVQYYRAEEPGFLGDRPYTSKDLDFYRNQEAAERLADALAGKVLIPGPDDMGPSAALVVGKLGGRKLEIDFMSTILGVESRQITNNQVLIDAPSPETQRPIRLLLLHPLDCFRSRLANTNTLCRHDEHSVSQARAAQEVLQRFLHDLLDQEGRFRHVQTILRDLSYVIRDSHAGEATHLRHALTPEKVLHAFRDDPRLDVRWREKILAPSIERVTRWLSTAEERQARSAARAE